MIQRAPLWSGNKFTPNTETILISGQIWGITKTTQICFRTSNCFQKCGTSIAYVFYVLGNIHRASSHCLSGTRTYPYSYDLHFIEAAEVLGSEELVQSGKADRQSYVTISKSTVTSNATILGIPSLAETFKWSILKSEIQ